MSTPVKSRSPVYYHRRNHSSSYTQETLQTNPDETINITGHSLQPARPKTQIKETSQSFASPSPKPVGKKSIPRPKSSLSTSKVSRTLNTQEDSRLSVNISKTRDPSRERDDAIKSFRAPSPGKSTPSSRPFSAQKQQRCVSARSSLTKLNTEPENNNKSPRLFSDYALKRIESEKKAQMQGIRLGLEGIDSALHRKNLEYQVKILENRLNKLKLEEVSMAKKIKETSDKTDKILCSKRRRQEELQKKEMMNKKREDDLQKKRDQINRERQELRENMRRSSLGNLKQKHEIACSTKFANEQEKMRKDDINRKRQEKNKEIISKVNGSANSSMTMKQTWNVSKVNEANQKYKDKISKDKEMAEVLAQKCRDLENIEHQMLEKLSQTYNLHKAKIFELEKAFSIKVKPDEDFYFGNQNKLA